MQALADKLRAMCASAHSDSITTAYQLFGIKYAPRLQEMMIQDLQRLSLKAGSDNPSGCGIEIRKGVNISPHVSLRTDPLDWDTPIRESNRNDEKIELLAQKLTQVRLQAPKLSLVRTVALFGIKHSDEIKEFTFGDLGDLCEMAGVKRMHRNELRQGQKLAFYVQFKSYPSKA